MKTVYLIAAGLAVTGFVLTVITINVQGSYKPVVKTITTDTYVPETDNAVELNDVSIAGLPQGRTRVFITPSDGPGNKALRNRDDVEVRHDFGKMFSANVDVSDLDELSKLAVITEVPIIEIEQADDSRKALTCGNGLVDSGEKCGEPGLDSCNLDEVCSACHCKRADQERVCTPGDQREYNVLQVNGGQLGDGAGTAVVVLDTGATIEHLDLDVSVCKDATHKGMRDGCDETNSAGHGTRNVGIVAANGGADGLGIYGVAPAADVWMIRVCNGSTCFIDDILEAMDFAGRRKVEVVSMSFGAPVLLPWLQDKMQEYPETLWVAAAGNRGPRQIVDYPAAYPEAVSVGAIDEAKEVVRFSSRGADDGDDAVISEKEVEFVAGGRLIESTNFNGCYNKDSGTSFSAPTLAGLAAAVWQGNPADTRAYLRTIVEDITVAPHGGAGPGYDIASGYGLPIQP